MHPLRAPDHQGRTRDCLLVPAVREEILKADLELEEEAIPPLRQAIVHCEKVHDFVSRDLFAHILENEEEHVDTLETQFEMIRQMGLENYIQLQSRPAGE